MTNTAKIDLLVVDTPVCADARIASLAQGSQLTVGSTRGSVDDLDLSIRLMHELKEKGVPDWRFALALCRVQNKAESMFARDYCRRAGYDVLKGEVTESRSFRDLQNRGHAITESPAASLVQETLELVKCIQVGFVSALERPRT